MRKLVGSGVLIAALIGASGAVAAPQRPVCPGPAAAGTSRCFAHVVTRPDGTPRATSGPTGYGPVQFHTGYNLPYTSSAAQTIAIVDAYDDPTVQSDLNTYDSHYGLLPCDNTASTSYCFEKLNQSGVQGSYPSANSGWALEIALDVETAREICQNCQIRLVEATSNSGSNLDAAEDTAYKLGATEISNSWGTSSEYSGEVAENSAHFNHPGVAITVASGDNGYNAFGFPAASPDVIAVGGTTLHLTASNAWSSETAWSGGGSGCSLYFGAQSWQPSALNWPLTGCGSSRGVADVAADADPNTGAAIYDSTRYQGQRGWFQVGGTSLASPLIAGVYALAGNAATTPYPASQPYGNTGSLHDVTQGSTGNCSGTTACTAGTGYDGPSGVGTPSGTVPNGTAAF